MLKINTIFLNESLQKEISKKIKEYAWYLGIEVKLTLIEIDERFLQNEVKNNLPYDIVTWKELNTLYEKQISTLKEDDKKNLNYRAVYTFCLKDDSIFQITELENFLIEEGLDETLLRPLPYCFECADCHWRGKVHELQSVDLFFDDIEDNVCP